LDDIFGQRRNASKAMLTFLMSSIPRLANSIPAAAVSSQASLARRIGEFVLLNGWVVVHQPVKSLSESSSSHQASFKEGLNHAARELCALLRQYHIRPTCSYCTRQGKSGTSFGDHVRTDFHRETIAAVASTVKQQPVWQTFRIPRKCSTLRSVVRFNHVDGAIEIWCGDVDPTMS
jgi:hypothetical protein